MTNHSRIDWCNASVVDVRDNQSLRATLASLPLCPCGDIDMQPLCRHPSSTHEDER